MEDVNTISPILLSISELRYVHNNSIPGKFENMNQVDQFGITLRWLDPVVGTLL